MNITIAQLEQALNLARRSHDGSCEVAPFEKNGLDYVEIAVLLTDMGQAEPLNIFYVTPKGRLALAP